MSTLTMHRRVRQVFCAIRERSSVSCAKMATVGGVCDINLIVFKATAPDDFPLQEKYIQELLKIFSVSPSSFHSFSLSFNSRFTKTHCWKVALKCLLLLHRLLRSLPESSPFRTELLLARSNGMLRLHPCRFRDDSSSTPADYTTFIRSYSHFVDEALSCFAFEDRKEEEDEGEDDDEVEVEAEERMPLSLRDKIKEVSRMLVVLPQLQSLIDRVMDCMPTSVAARSFIVKSAMKHIIRDSFICYTTFRKEIVLVLDNLFQMPYRSSILAFGIYKKAALQADQLCEFYDWCKAKGMCGAYEYPFIERIPQIQIRALETFLNGMWQLTEPSSTATSPSLWVDSNKSSWTEEEDDGDEEVAVGRGVVISTQWEKFEEGEGVPRKLRRSHEEEMAPLIQLQDSENDGSWEALLEASINLPLIPRNNHLNCSPGNPDCYGDSRKVLHGKENNQLQTMQVYSPCAFNPFCQPHCIAHGNSPDALNPLRQPHHGGPFETNL